MNNNMPMIKKEGLFTKIKSWFKRLFAKEEVVIESFQEPVKNEIEEIKKASFKEGLKVKTKDIILLLQRQLEEKQIQISDLTDEQLEEMIELYENQIQDKKKILKQYESKRKLN